jgi:hypothetical protein
MAESSWWYSVVGASPDPEKDEVVNVGILVGNGRPSRFEYEPTFRRLACLNYQFEADLLRQAFKQVTKNLGHFDSLAAIQDALGPQVVVREPRALHVRPDARLVQQLMNKYLLGEPVARAHSSFGAPKRLAYLDRALNRVLQARGFGYEFKKTPKPADLYPDLEQSLFAVPIPSVDRAIRHENRDLLIGGVRLDTPDPLDQIRSPGTRLGRAFWHYSQQKDAIEKLAGVQIRTLGVILAPSGDRDPRVDEAAHYLRHVWRADADQVLLTTELDVETELDREISWLG